ncbi:AAA family ATPase [endosymbiont of Lamellibrachia barhami]|uniref:AAA family ATPase n=1 Tax=endosymbiont of Lamellibrachia barhami TaxID=205975 RepID=UPI0015AB21AA|nr:AAA family ATPase [endosymbiont of Lamellibrachia barhami]
MRILQVRFKNLNSLAGEWAIDLACPAFSSDGIFAITGPTGAGKTTILDAICLALYGRTPRLNKVTKSGNEIMSRQTGECFAEVTFETQAGRFRCHWSQHRARKKPGGELQAPKHEIADVDSGRILEAKLRGVADQIETVTGMDFDRFTRSMLLAQGGFAAFLQAAPDERAPILEQITGTEIYSQISIQVHKRHSEEREKLDLLQAELAGMQLLSEEDEQQLKAGLEQRVLQEAGLNQQVDQKGQAIAWLDGIERLEEELNLLQEQKQDLKMRQEVFHPEGEKLERAMQALELAGDFASLSSLRREQETDQQRHKEYLLTLPEKEAEVRRAEETWKLTNEQLKQKRGEQKETLLVIGKVRVLDTKLREKEAPVRMAANVLRETEETLVALRARHSEGSQILDEQKVILKEVQKLLSESEADKGLVEQLARILSQFDRLRELDGNVRDKAGEVVSAETQKREASRLWSEQSKMLRGQNDALEVIQKKLLQQQNELTDILAEREVSLWRNLLSDLKERESLLRETGKSLHSLSESRISLGQLKNQYEKFTAEEGPLARQILEQTERFAVLERELLLLETQLSLLTRIQSFEEARQQLQDGEACPLCGAEEHPYAEGNIPATDETATELKRVREDLKQARDRLSGLQIKQAETRKDLQQNETLQQQVRDRISTEEQQIREGFRVLAVVEDGGDDPADALPGLQQENREKLEMTAKIVSAAERYEKEIASLRELIEETRETLDQSEQEIQGLLYKKHAAGQAVDGQKDGLDALRIQLQNAQEQTLQDLRGYGFQALATDALKPIQTELITRRDQWLDRQKQQNDLERHISNLELQTDHQATQINTSEAVLIEQREILRNLIREQDSLTRDRIALFADKNPDTEETRLFTSVEAAEKQLEESRQVFHLAAGEQGKLKAAIALIERTVLGRADQLKQSQEAFKIRLGQFDFTDEASYQAACLPEEERNNLMQQAQRLATEQTELNTRRRDRSSLLDIERKKQTTDQSRDQLKEALEALVNRRKSLQQEVGGMRQKLDDNENLRRKQQDRAKLIDAQKSECSRWGLLHELIGSADGKKYRNFAQGLTFEMMVGHANRQLQKMTDRYLLIRDDGQPLELNVVDNYQAGEIRSTKNLSGGESFIVSLSLALGLSQMASKNVRVDSLFLDEGFGTLDEEALDTALETLAGLQQDGKLIGVISHVSALKERIATQIEVMPQAGGRSTISGPGCGRVE